MKNKLKVQRAIHDLTQAQLAEKINVTLWTVNSWEKNKYCPNLKYALRLARLFNVPVDTLFNFDDEEITDVRISDE